ncbi:hypothetical protein AX15_001007 [Amanita polypyramis BW_CC]|nr:hypothetical protein AX15_001007 [Amanita polypyramis BW_CC]
MSPSFVLYDPLYSYTFDRLIHEAFDAERQPSSNGSGERRNAVKTLRPRMDLHENAEANTVTATFELPGITKESVQIDVQNGLLNISGENKISSEHEENGYAVRERRYGKFVRTLQLPRGVEVNESCFAAMLSERVIDWNRVILGGPNQSKVGGWYFDRYLPEDNTRDGSEEDFHCMNKIYTLVN